MIRVLPLEQSHLADAGRFLNQHLNARISVDDWIQSLTHRWAESQPNFGMRLLDDDRLVGVFCAIYSDQEIGGRRERLCNPHSWCVLDQYRAASIGLVLQLLKQPGYHFTMYTPNPKVAQIFQGLKFRNLDDRLFVFPNLPALSLPRAGRFLETDAHRVQARLSGPSLRAFNEHRQIGWLRFVAFGAGDDACLVVYKPGRWKRLPCARLLHVSAPDVFARHGALLKSHLLRQGFLVSKIEARMLKSQPLLARRLRRLQPKLVLSKTLGDADFSDLYSELASLDV